MATLGELVEEIRDDLNRGTSFDPRIRRAIADAILSYRSRRVGFNVKRAFATLQPGMEYVSLPTDWIEADFLQLKSGTRREPLDEVTYDTIEDHSGPTDDRDEPYQYAIQNRTLRLYPIPDQTYTLMFSYHFEWKNVSKSASENASNPWLTEGKLVISAKAKADLYINYMDGEQNQARGDRLLVMADGDIKSGDDGLIGKLEAQAAREQSSGKIKPFM